MRGKLSGARWDKSQWVKATCWSPKAWNPVFLLSPSESLCYSCLKWQCCFFIPWPLGGALVSLYCFLISHLLFAKRCQRFIYFYFLFSREEYFKTILCDVSVSHEFFFFFFFLSIKMMLASSDGSESNFISDTLGKKKEKGSCLVVCPQIMSHVSNWWKIYCWAENLYFVLFLFFCLNSDIYCVSTEI